MHTGEGGFHPPSPSPWSPAPRELQVTVRGPSTQIDQCPGLGWRPRKTLVALDIACLLMAAVPFLLCELGLVPPVRRGFYCNDSSIRYPLMAAETVSDGALVSIGLLLSATAIALGESYRVRRQGLGPQAYAPALYKELGAFLFGCTVGQSLTNVAKVAVGRLRPHFLAVCCPDMALVDCSRGYVEAYICTASPSEEKEASRKSFYSGHASFAMYTMTYLVLYMQAQGAGRRAPRALLQATLLLLALGTGLTRVAEHRHHPADVAAGLLQGILVATWAAFHISGMFQPQRLAPQQLPPCSDSPTTIGHTHC
ncbi:phospholipid phosphatase 3-like isoform X1 [Alligator sinensis]|uniref:Phospholipid phosphatase 3-like isoform X1 n=1 Tax=Alligator sinensis TaxID=38654 RepID=A0A1U8DDQ1_ALLSI|nr:phospholipid phosphatase 3-like isoform X1 [Alligator sinensis]XP_014375310.1 phospholipid phosphatase 3-like isoform X1 [Alligator sinensis]